MAAVEYRVLYADTGSGQILGELPVRSFSFTESLNEPGSFSASLPLESAVSGRLAGSVGRLEIDPATFGPDGRTTVIVERDGAPVWAGLLWGVSADLGKGTASISGAGLMSYFARRLITSDVSFSSVEQAGIAWSLIDTAQSVGGSMGIVNGSSPTGVNRDRTYLGADAMPVLKAVQNLAAVNNGFDFRVGLSWSGATLVKTFLTSYPQTGRATNILLDAASNLADMSVRMDGSKVTSKAFADGAPGATRQEVTNAALELAVPRLESLVSFSTVSEDATLLAHAESVANRGSEAVKVVKASLGRGTYPALGDFIVGDNVALRGSLGWLDLAGQYRVGSYKVKVDGEGGENVSLTLASEGAYG